MKSKLMGKFCVSICMIIVGIMFVATPSSAQTTFISIAAGGTGGVYYPYAGGLAEIWTRHVPGVQAVAEVTGASVENIRLLNRAESLTATVMNDAAYQAYYAEGRFDGNPQNVRAMFQMYPHHYHVVALKGSGINTIYDIKGKHVSVGAPASGTEFKTDLIFKALGISYNDFRVHRLSFTETANALKDRTIDVGIWDVAAPTSSIMDLAVTRDIVLIPFSDEDMQKIIDAYPFYSPFVLPADSYRGVDYPVSNPSVWNSVLCNADLPDDLVYQLVKAVFEHQDYLKMIHPFAAYSTPENAMVATPIPLHPGAVKYYKEKGYEIPDHLMPK